MRALYEPYNVIQVIGYCCKAEVQILVAKVLVHKFYKG